MSKILNSIFGLVLIASAIKPFFVNQIDREYQILGLALPKYIYISIYFILGAALLFSAFKDKKQEN